jgi:hypothetical protein
VNDLEAIEARLSDLEMLTVHLMDHLRRGGISIPPADMSHVVRPGLVGRPEPLDPSNVGHAPGHHTATHGGVVNPLGDEGRPIGIAQPPLRKDVIGG